MPTTLSITYHSNLAGTSTEVFYPDFDLETIHLPQKEYKYTDNVINSLHYSWEEKFSDKNVFTSSFDEIDKYNILHKFANYFLSNAQDIDPSFANVINDDFWNLI